MEIAMDREAKRSHDSGFQNIENAAAQSSYAIGIIKDIVLAASFNSSGSRVALCSADHKIRVYSIDQSDVWLLLDQWHGHDAEVLDVQWLSSGLGHLFATIGGDNKFKLWREDPSQSVKGGRRFKCLYSQSPPNHVSYVSFGTKTLNQETWLSLFTHDGLLSLLEPADPEFLSSWSQIDSIWPFQQHPRDTEARFRLSFHLSDGPSANALAAGLDPKALSLAVSASRSIKIIRAIKPSEPSEGNYQMHEMIELKVDHAVINEIAWAPGCLHPLDIIAAACDDGTVRVFEVDIPYDRNGPSRKMNAVAPPLDLLKAVRAPELRKIPSGISAGLAGLSRGSTVRNEVIGRFDMRHEGREIAVLSHNEGASVWKIRWTQDGSFLISTGDDGKVHLWRESIGGNYIEFAENGPF